MNHRRLVGIDLGIASAHTVRVLDGTARRSRNVKHGRRSRALERSRPLHWRAARLMSDWRW